MFSRPVLAVRRLAVPLLGHAPVFQQCRTWLTTQSDRKPSKQPRKAASKPANPSSSPHTPLQTAVAKLVAKVAHGSAPTKREVVEVFVFVKQAMAESTSACGDNADALETQMKVVCVTLKPLLRDFAAFGITLDPPMSQMLVTLHCKGGMLGAAGWLIRQLPQWQPIAERDVLNNYLNMCRLQGMDTDALRTTVTLLKSPVWSPLAKASFMEYCTARAKTIANTDEVPPYGRALDFLREVKEAKIFEDSSIVNIAAELCMIKPDRADDMITYLQTTWGHIRNATALESVLRGYIAANDVEASLNCVKAMRRFGSVPSTGAFNALLRLCGASSDPTTTTGVLNGMAACGIVPDQHSIASVMTGYISSGRHEDALILLKLATSHDMPTLRRVSRSLFRAIITQLEACSDVTQLPQYRYEAHTPPEPVWDVLMFVWREMVAGISPDDVEAEKIRIADSLLLCQCVLNTAYRLNRLNPHPECVIDTVSLQQQLMDVMHVSIGRVPSEAVNSMLSLAMQAREDSRKHVRVMSGMNAHSKRGNRKDSKGVTSGSGGVVRTWAGIGAECEAIVNYAVSKGVEPNEVMHSLLLRALLLERRDDDALTLALQTMISAGTPPTTRHVSVLLTFLRQPHHVQQVVDYMTEFEIKPDEYCLSMITKLKQKQQATAATTVSDVSDTNTGVIWPLNLQDNVK